MILSKLKKRRGAYLVEFALVSIIFFMFLFGILEYARLLMMMEMLENAAREGARFAVVHTSDMTTLDVQNQVDTRLANLGAELQSYNRTTSIHVYTADSTTGGPVDANGNPVSDWTLAPFTNAKFGQTIAVQITGTYRPVLPVFLIMGASIQLQTRYLMYSEAN
jgi:Flp pilus assembly protein TadG